MTKKIISFIALVFAIAIPTQISTHAATQSAKNLVVTATGGLNLRDQNCKKFDTLGYGSWITSENLKPTINCNINGKSTEMIYITYFGGDQGYVAKSFTSVVNYNSFDYTGFNGIKYTNPQTVPVLKVNVLAGLNIRDQDCKRIATVANGTELKPVTQTDNYITCKAGNSYYQLSPIWYNGDQYFAANYYLVQVR